MHVAFQFWIPISLGGFFVSGRELEAALRSSNPTSYITKLFLKHLSANTTAGELLSHLEAPVVEAAINRFLEWVVPHFHHFTGNSINTVNTYTLWSDKKKKHKTRKTKRSLSKRFSSRKKRREASLELESSEEVEEGKNIVKGRSKGLANDCLTLSPKCPDENETKEPEITHSKTRRSPDVASDTKQAGNTHTKAHRRSRSHITERKLDELTDLTEGLRDPDQDERHTNSKSRKRRQTEEGSLDEATELAGGQRDESHIGLRRQERQVRGDSDGWVTIGGRRGSGSGGEYSVRKPTSPLLTRPSAWSSYRPQQVPNDRLLWEDDHHIIMHNDLSMEQDKRPGKRSQ